MQVLYRSIIRFIIGQAQTFMNEKLIIENRSVRRESPQIFPVSCTHRPSLRVRECAVLQRCAMWHRSPLMWPVWHDSNASRTVSNARRHSWGSGDWPHSDSHCRWAWCDPAALLCTECLCWCSCPRRAPWWTASRLQVYSKSNALVGGKSNEETTPALRSRHKRN